MLLPTMSQLPSGVARRRSRCIAAGESGRPRDCQPPSRADETPRCVCRDAGRSRRASAQDRLERLKVAVALQQAWTTRSGCSSVEVEDLYPQDEVLERVGPRSLTRSGSSSASGAACAIVITGPPRAAPGATRQVAAPVGGLSPLGPRFGWSTGWPSGLSGFALGRHDLGHEVGGWAGMSPPSVTLLARQSAQ